PRGTPSRECSWGRRSAGQPIDRHTGPTPPDRYVTAWAGAAAHPHTSFARASSRHGSGAPRGVSNEADLARVRRRADALLPRARYPQLSVIELLVAGQIGKNFDPFQPPDPPWCDTPKMMLTFT